MKYSFNYKNTPAELDYNMWTGSSKLTWSNQVLTKKGRSWTTPDGKLIKYSSDKFFLPALQIDDEKIVFVKLEKWQWFFVFLPIVLIAFGGAIPGGLAFLGVYLNVQVMQDESKSNVMKVIYCLGYCLLAILAILLIAAILSGD